MTLRHALRICGYTPNDLKEKLKKKGYPLNVSEIRNLCTAYRPGGSSVWNAVLSCLDDMGVDW